MIRVRIRGTQIEGCGVWCGEGVRDEREGNGMSHSGGGSVAAPATVERRRRSGRRWWFMVAEEEW